MTTDVVDQIARAALYGLDRLGPCRPAAPTHWGQVTGGVVLPPGVGDGARSQVETQCLVRAPGAANLDVQVRFLHLSTCHLGEARWTEAAERVVRLQVSLADGCARPICESFRWPGCQTADRQQESLRGDVEVLVERVGSDPDFFKVTVILANTTLTPGGRLDRTSALRFSLVSAHVLIDLPRGRFVSLVDPADGAEAEAARTCRQTGLWPVLVGEADAGQALLAAPIAADPAGGAPRLDDDLLVLRVLSLTEDEKREMRQAEAGARRLLERAENQAWTDRRPPARPRTRIFESRAECRP